MIEPSSSGPAPSESESTASGSTASGSETSSGAAGIASNGSEPTDVERVAHLGRAHARMVEQIRHRIVGQDEVIELMLIALFARGHGLFVGVPGLAKTLLISTVAEVLSLRSSRIQFTPDLMPTDITGTEILEEDPASGQRRFRFVPGPIFTHVLLADEINRTPPKTQAALLQSMAEGAVTAGGHTHALEKPYVVFATQNPIEQEGTYPLPEAQLDRFLFQIDVGYPSRDEELEIVRRTTAPASASPHAVIGRDEILALQELVPRVPIAPHVVDHAVSLVRASRPDDDSASADIKRLVSFGAGPRASQALVLGAKARAVLQGRFAAEIEDVRALALPVLRHRVVPSYRAQADGVRASELVARLLASVPH